MRRLARIADELKALRKGSTIPSLEELIEQEIELEIIRGPQSKAS
jgi:hypothetical protein